MSIKKYIPLILVLVFILLIGAGYFLISPKYQDLKRKRAEVETRDEEFRVKEEHFLNLENTLNTLSNYEDKISKINSALPSRSSEPDLLNYFQKTSSENGLILKGINANSLFSAEGLPGEKIKKLPLSVDLIGSYASLKSFIFSIYKSARLIEIKSISFSVALEEGTETRDLFDFNIELETHAYDPTPKPVSSD
jgi:Tfp pilus assembly protein PilO